MNNLAQHKHSKLVDTDIYNDVFVCKSNMGNRMCEGEQMMEIMSTISHALLCRGNMQKKVKTRKQKPFKES